MKKQLVKCIVAVLTALSLVVGPLASVSAATPEYLIISRDSLMELPASGTSWNTIKASADASVTPDLCNQDNKADVNALAAGIVYARTGDIAYRTKAINLINAAKDSQRDGCANAVLAMGRQLGGYVMAADFVNYRDASFVTWLGSIIDRNIGGHSSWFNLRTTAYVSANNWGIYALASITTADIYLDRTADIAKDWGVFSAYGVAHGWPFKKTADYKEQWSCIATDSTGKLPIAINTPCVKSGINLDGAPVEDSSRSAFGSYSTYIHESTPGFVVMAQLFNRTGRNGWTVNDSQVCRAVKFSDRSGRLNDSSVSYFVAFMANRFCSLNLPTKTPTSGGRMFGFSDWLFSGTPTPTSVTPTSVVTSSTPLPTITSTVLPTSTAISVPTNTPTAVPTITPIVVSPPQSNTTASVSTFVIETDARVNEIKPDTNYGTYGTVLYVDGGADLDIESYLRFTVAGISGTVTNAKLRLYVTEGSTNGPAVYTTDNTWTETGITWNNRPARTSSALEDKNVLGINTWVEYDVTLSITGDGTYSFVLATDSTDGMTLSSREGSPPAQLVVTIATE